MWKKKKEPLQWWALKKRFKINVDSEKAKCNAWLAMNGKKKLLVDKINILMT